MRADLVITNSRTVDIQVVSNTGAPSGRGWNLPSRPKLSLGSLHRHHLLVGEERKTGEPADRELNSFHGQPLLLLEQTRLARGRTIRPPPTSRCSWETGMEASRRRGTSALVAVLGPWRWATSRAMECWTWPLPTRFQKRLCADQQHASIVSARSRLKIQSHRSSRLEPATLFAPARSSNAARSKNSGPSRIRTWDQSVMSAEFAQSIDRRCVLLSHVLVPIWYQLPNRWAGCSP